MGDKQVKTEVATPPGSWLGKEKQTNKDSDRYFQNATQVQARLKADREEPVEEEEGRATE